jgi:hypothetical protein
MTEPPKKAAGEAAFEHACALDAAGRAEEAKAAYLAVLARQPTHSGALNNLGTLLYETGYRSAAQTAYAEAVKRHPEQPMGHDNLANTLLAGGELATARVHYETALRLAPDHVEAHRGLANLLAELGEEALARRHRDAAYQARPVTVQRYRGAGPGIPLLQLISAAGGNVPTRTLIDDRRFRVTVLAAEYFDPAATLPAHKFVFNAIGDPDLCGPALVAAERLLAGSAAAILKRPAAILATGRAALAGRLAGLPGVMLPRIVSLPRAQLDRADAAAVLAGHGLSFPLLLRSPGFHTGRHFVRIETADELHPALAALPGREVMAIEPLDARGGDGLARKYRVMFIDGALYPLHMAVSGDWKVHYFTADMAEHPEHRAEEAAFLADPASILGGAALATLDAIRVRLGLDYGGIDFGRARNGDLLVFEANATMVINPPDADSRWDYRRPPVERALAGARAMLERAASTP